VRVWFALGLLVLAQDLTRPSVLASSHQDPPANVESQDAARPSFEEFLAGVRVEALERGVREDIVDLALSTVEAPLPIIIERDRTQAEAVLSLDDYLSRRVTARQVTRARDGLTRHRALLEKVAARYDVEPEIIVAVWGMESNFGRFSGVRPTIPALATLAWDPRRSTLFRSELFAALDILNAGDIQVSNMRGSWAGAMGQVQFMPSSYLKFAEDFDGDGRRDIWSTPADVFASIGNYLKAAGWTRGQGWGREVHVSQESAQEITKSVARQEATCRAKRDLTVALPMAEWQQAGVRLTDGADLPTSTSEASLMAAGSTRSFLVNSNYNALLDYNCSHSYAISVGLLADRLGKSASKAKTQKAASQSRARS
jgi:membrane-bound lytic murein transglycosylase B